MLENIWRTFLEIVIEYLENCLSVLKLNRANIILAKLRFYQNKNVS